MSKKNWRFLTCSS